MIDGGEREGRKTRWATEGAVVGGEMEERGREIHRGDIEERGAKCRKEILRRNRGGYLLDPNIIVTHVSHCSRVDNSVLFEFGERKIKTPFNSSFTHSMSYMGQAKWDTFWD